MSFRDVPPASTPREAVEQLIARGIVPFPPGPHVVSRGRVTLRRLDPATGVQPQPQVERDRVVVEGPPLTIHQETVQILKEREIAGQHLFAVAFEETVNVLPGGKRRAGGAVLVAESNGTGGWRAVRGCGLPTGTRPPTTEPYALLASGWNRERGFCGAARLHRGDTIVTSIRLHFPDGTYAEADADDDLALFLVQQRQSDVPATAPFTPETLDLLDGDAVVGTQSVPQPPQRQPPEAGPPLSSR